MIFSLTADLDLKYFLGVSFSKADKKISIIADLTAEQKALLAVAGLYSLANI